MKNNFTKLIVSLTIALLPQKAAAYKQVYAPLNVAVLKADIIVEARTIRVSKPRSGEHDTADVEIKKVFKGKVKPGFCSVQLQPTHIMALGYLQPNKNYILFLRTVDKSHSKLEIMLDGTRLYSEKDAKLIATAVTLTPDWSKAKNGFSTVLTAEKFRLGINDNINLWIGYKNTSDRVVSLKSTDWPLESHTFWKLHIKLNTGGDIKAIPHPTLTKEDIDEYFSKFPHSYEVQLKPQESTYFSIPKINSAKPGWGYKEGLDFKYYPMTVPGNYTISASAHNLYEELTIPAKGLRIWLY